jgi:hypothetical protein
MDFEYISSTLISLFNKFRHKGVISIFGLLALHKKLINQVYLKATICVLALHSSFVIWGFNLRHSSISSKVNNSHFKYFAFTDAGMLVT